LARSVDGKRQQAGVWLCSKEVEQGRRGQGRSSCWPSAQRENRRE
jgi:hypothetical protein